MDYDINKLKLPEGYKIKEHTEDKLVVGNGETELELKFKKQKYWNMEEHINVFSGSITKHNTRFDTFDSPWRIDVRLKEIQDVINGVIGLARSS